MASPPRKPPARSRVTTLYTHPRSVATAGREIIKTPSDSAVTDASRQIRKSHPSGGYTMAAKKVAIGEGVAKRRKKAPPRKTW
jgi:hypothetical protein